MGGGGGGDCGRVVVSVPVWTSWRREGWGGGSNKGRGMYLQGWGREGEGRGGMERGKRDKRGIYFDVLVAGVELWGAGGCWGMLGGAGGCWGGYITLTYIRIIYK